MLKSSGHGAFLFNGYALFWVTKLNQNQKPLMEQNYQQQPMLTPPKNWLVESILVTIFCCLPFGIVGIIYASQVSSKFAAGDHQGALNASRDAAKWTKIGFWVGLSVLILYIIAVFAFGLTAFWANEGKFNDYR
ncbi:MAG TPA: CD225/dispanin family protein [Chitinophagaceae bacterium]